MMPQTCPSSVVSPGRVRSPRGLIALLVGLALSVGVSLRAQAATTWTVCASGCDYTRIKAAIAAPTTVDGDTLAIAAWTYTEAGIVVDKSLTLRGEDADTTIVQTATTRGTATDRVFTIASGVTATLQDLTIRYGLSPSPPGGGLYNQGTLTLTRSTVRDNATTYAGGGIGNPGTLTLITSTVHDNTATYEGGGIGNPGTLTLITSTARDNAATFGGGLLNNYQGTLTLINTTVSGNSATDGGGLHNAGVLTLTHSTLSGNAAEVGGGLSNWGALTLTQSIVASNPQGQDCYHASGTVTSTGYNLDSDTSCQLTAPTDLPGTDPQLGPLQDNGGATLTHALFPGSPAIDAIPWGANGCGTTLLSDQRWQARPQPSGGRCDIGAYEVEVDGQALAGWVTGLTPSTVVCQSVTTAQVVTLSDPVSPWDCEAAGLGVTPGDRVTMHVRGRIKQRAPDIGGAVTGMIPTSGGCANLTTGQQVRFQHMVGATAASCVAAGLVVQEGEAVQMRVQGAAEYAGSALRGPSLVIPPGPGGHTPVLGGSAALHSRDPQSHGGTTMHLSTKHPTRVRQTWGQLVMAALVGTVGLWQPCLAAEFSCAAGDMACLIEAIKTANANGEKNRIALGAGTFTLTTVDNNTHGPNGLPSITGGLTITGAGADTTRLERAAGAPPFRLLHVAATGVLALEGLTLRGGELADRPGGGIYIRGTLTLTDSTLRDNTASEGGGLYHSEDSAGTLTITRSILSGNVASHGGGIYSLRPLTLTHSTVSGNVAHGSGGGLYIHNSVTLTHSTVSGNVAHGSDSAGGGIYSWASLTLTHSTVSGNVAHGSGGGIIQGISTLTLTNCTLSGNTASQGGGISIMGGGLLAPSGHAILRNTILAQNTVPPTGTGPDCVTTSGGPAGPGRATSQGHNLLGDPTGCTISLAASDLTGDPGVGDFVDDGTPGRGHVPLLPGSRAIDAIPWGANGCGTTLLSDQRGQARPQPAGGACDIGAYEVDVAGQALSAWVTGLMPHTAVCENVTTGQAVTLSDPVSPWDCEAAGLAVRSGDQVGLRVRGPVMQGATDVGGAVVGMTPSRGSCTNRTTGQQVQFQHMAGATAASCVAAGLLVHPGETVQLRVQGAAE